MKPGIFIAIGFVCLLTLANQTISQTQYTSVASGKWTDCSNTWGVSTPPQIGDPVTISASDTVVLDFDYSSTILKNLKVNGTLIIENSGAISVGSIGIGKSVDVSGALEIKTGGALYVQGAPISITGTVVVNSSAGGIDAVNSNITATSAGAITYEDGYIFCNNMSLNSGTTLYACGSPTGYIYVDGSATFSGNILPTASGIFPSSSFITVNGNMIVGGQLSVGANNISGNYTVYGSLSLQTGSQVQYIANGNQVIDASKNYYSLRLGGSGTKSLSAHLNIANTFIIDGTATFVNSNNSVTCGSSFINNSSAMHSLGGGTYTFTGTTIGGSGTTDFTGSTVNFSGSSITIGDGSEGDGNISFGNVNFTNTNSAVTVGANSYAGTVQFGILSLSGDNATLAVHNGTVSMSSLTVSGSNSYTSFDGGSVGVTGNLTSGNWVVVSTPTTVGGDVTTSGNLTVEDEFDVTGTADVGGTFKITSSGTGQNDFSDLVTVTGAVVNLSAGTSVFNGGLTHSSTAVGSVCTIGGNYSVGGTGNGATTINAENVTIKNTPDFYSLSLNNASGSASSTASFTVRNTLSLAKDIDMGSSVLTFAAAAPKNSTLGAGEVIGRVQRTLEASGTYTFNGTNTSLLVPGSSGPEVYEFRLVKSAPDAQAVSRYYDIQRTAGDVTPASLTYSLSLEYRDAEMNGNDENGLLLAYGDLHTAGEDQFSKLTSSSVNTTSNIVNYQFDGVMSFNHRYTLADLNAVLPVELVAFAGRRKGPEVELRWKTATELNNFGFEIERATSKEGPFETLGFVDGMGTKNTETDYMFADVSAPEATLFYRLRQIDRDGKETYSPVVEVTKGTPDFTLRNYPNPFNPSTVITFTAAEDGHARLRIFNALGEEVAVAYDASVMKGEHVSVPFDAGHLPGGTYFYVLTNGTHTRTGKMLLTK